VANGLATRRRCVTLVRKQCRRVGLSVCSPPPTTSSTTTTTSTTSTTTLVRGPYHGAWDFSGTLDEDTCGWAAATTGDTATVSQEGSFTSATAQLATWPGVVLFGGVNADGLLALAGDTRRSDGCPVRLVTVFGTPNGSKSVPGAAGFSVSCFGYSTCFATYLGVWTRR
jgi:hypothetical protein